jgi:CRP/FNR family transcriptional regulator, nitrogen oxide reductase regulator
MKRWIITYPQIALNSIRILSGFILDFQDRIRELSTERVERRIARSLLRLASHGGGKPKQEYRW